MRVLQVEREFQQQGHLYQHCVFLVFDEVRRDHEILEDTLKLFCSGGKILLRKNHEQETKYTSWEYCAKCWLMNTADIPSIPSAFETSHSRRFRATFMRANLTHDMEEVDVEKKNFHADADAKSFISSPPAVWSFFHDWLFPFMQQTRPMSWRSNLNHPEADSSAAKALSSVQCFVCDCKSNGLCCRFYSVKASFERLLLLPASFGAGHAMVARKDDPHD